MAVRMAMMHGCEDGYDAWLCRKLALMMDRNDACDNGRDDHRESILRRGALSCTFPPVWLELPD